MYMYMERLSCSIKKKACDIVMIHLYTVYTCIQISDQDLAKRRNEQRVDMSTAGVRISSLTQTLSSSATEESSSPTENTEEEEEEDKRVELNVYDEELVSPHEVSTPKDTKSNDKKIFSTKHKHLL